MSVHTQNILIILSLVLFGALLFSTVIMRDFGRQRRKARSTQRLRQQISQLRLSKMLSFLGVPLDAYLDNISMQEIEKEIKICSQCTDTTITETCDACLRDRKLVRDMNFCPNYKTLIAHSKIIARRG